MRVDCTSLCMRGCVERCWSGKGCPESGEEGGRGSLVSGGVFPPVDGFSIRVGLALGSRL
jgi:hypothetical protein